MGPPAGAEDEEGRPSDEALIGLFKKPKAKTKSDPATGGGGSGSDDDDDDDDEDDDDDDEDDDDEDDEDDDEDDEPNSGAPDEKPKQKGRDPAGPPSRPKTDVPQTAATSSLQTTVPHNFDGDEAEMLFESEADKNRLMALPEYEREVELNERHKKLIRERQRQQLLATPQGKSKPTDKTPSSVRDRDKERQAVRESALAHMMTTKRDRDQKAAKRLTETDTPGGQSRKRKSADKELDRSAKSQKPSK
eukprot:Selendium_serpulae@DN9271_c0_g1_i1.p1